MFSLSRRACLTTAIAIALMTYAGSIAENSSGRAFAQSAKTSFKGWEVYSWQENDKWFFAMMMGTNRLKTCAEIKSGRMPLTISNLDIAFKNLEPHENVIWSVSRIEGCTLSLPSTQFKKEAGELARKYQLDLTIQ
jgi:hypothetical protein